MCKERAVNRGYGHNKIKDEYTAMKSIDMFRSLYTVPTGDNVINLDYRDDPLNNVMRIVSYLADRFDVKFAEDMNLACPFDLTRERDKGQDFVRLYFY